MTNLVSFITFRCPLFPKTSFLVGTFCAISYSNSALGFCNKVTLFVMNPLSVFGVSEKRTEREIALENFTLV